MTDTKKTLAQRLVSSMRSIDAITKSGFNERQKYNYVKAADVANEVRKVLCEQGIAFTYSIDDASHWEKPTNGGGILFFCEIRAAFRFIDQDSGETLDVKGLGWGADSLDKAPYKAMTGALKYALRMNFLIPDEEDPEKTNELYDERGHMVERGPAPVQSIRKPGQVQVQTGQGDAYEADPLFDENGDLIESKTTIQHREQKQAAKLDAAPPSAVPAQGPVISEAQAKRFLAIAKTGGKSWPEIDAALESIGVKKAVEIPRNQYDTFIEWAGGKNERRA